MRVNSDELAGCLDAVITYGESVAIRFPASSEASFEAETQTPVYGLPIKNYVRYAWHAETALWGAHPPPPMVSLQGNQTPHGIMATGACLQMARFRRSHPRWKQSCKSTRTEVTVLN